MNHKIARIVFALIVGLGVATYAYQRVSDPQPRLQRQQEERIVLLARAAVRETIAANVDLEIVDPLATNRVAGKVYIYPAAGGWDVSGHYRRTGEEIWHPWLMRLDEDGVMQRLSVRDSDPELLRRAASVEELSVDP